MAYEYENKINEAFFKAGRDGRNVDNELLAELQEAYRKAKAFDEIMKGELGAYYDKAKSFDEIVKAVNAPYVEYPEDWMVDVLKVVRNFEQGSAHDER
ncbi:hypothetical protein BU097_02450 [Staphylococcus xylosus]|uniref:Phage protein n=1 Tax=Staphylococcus xylosus TaxID=1288 RepID=A0A418IRG0_STAXY|nr:hypothetical protein [Staphylococcus xylosus]PTI58827.1 hypothetical protein BU103_03335 [Staphylococcus xylosus]RIN12408.1 hypothetical protein BU097_02450 [Staphylococcus xylosus]